MANLQEMKLVFTGLNDEECRDLSDNSTVITDSSRLQFTYNGGSGSLFDFTGNNTLTITNIPGQSVRQTEFDHIHNYLYQFFAV